MEELKRLLIQAGDEYLTGLSNRGMVKRAYKDLEQETPEVSWKGNEAEVRLKDAVCRIKVPLGDSACSCPSRSMCRHRIAAMIFLRKGLEGESGEKTSDEKINPEKELLSVPLRRLQQACRIKAYREFLSHIERGEYPRIEEGSTVTVQIPWENVTVKLLSPLEYSTCTCHSRELCAHKAQAILAYQLLKKTITPGQLKTLEDNRENPDRETVLQAVRSIKEGIRLQLMTGLSRLSPEAEESMERLAVICHGAGLPAFESRFRGAAVEFRQYFTRSAAFREADLMGRLLFLYRDAVRLEQAGVEEMRSLAGTFRDTYERVPPLHLMGVGSSYFKNKAGYEGERYYFLELEQKKWYTWTDARPSFYEGVRGRPPRNEEHAQAPWGLNCSRGKMMELEFYLTDAKAAKGGRLSVSRETKSEIVGNRDLSGKEIREMVIWDYHRLFQRQMIQNREPVLAGAVHCKKGRFDTVKQRFDMEIYDVQGNCLHVAVTYSKEERLTIRVLERLSGRLDRQEDSPLVFFGIPYLEEGKICLYPVEYFDGAGLCPSVNGSESGQENRIDAGALSAGVIRAAEQCLQEIRVTLSDLFQSGLRSVQPETLSQMYSMEREAAGLGLHLAGEELSRLRGQLESQRHQIKSDPEPVIGIWVRLMEYLTLGLQRTQMDLAMAGMRENSLEGEETYESE